MTGLEIVLLIAGFSCLCISLFVARRTVPEQNQTDEVRTSAIWTEKEKPSGGVFIHDGSMWQLISG